MNTLVYNKHILSFRTLAILLTVAAIVLPFDNGFYLFLCLATIACIVTMLWRNPRPGILVLAFLMQWSQVVTYVIWMDVNGYAIDRLSRHAGEAIICSCIGLLVMALVINLAIRHIRLPTSQEMRQAASTINLRRVLILYISSAFFLDSIGFVFGATSGFAQILVTISYMKWIFFLVYGYCVWLDKGSKLIFAVIVLLEFISSLYSYFSSFKDVILMTLMIAIAFIRKITFRQFVYSILTGFLLFTLLITWTAIKGDYRDYLNQGKKQQTIEVSRSDAYGKIGEQIGNLSWGKIQMALNMAMYRLQYVWHLAKTMDRVPAVMPHEYGALWWNNITFVITPRVLFPDKPIYEATEKTKKYTGVNYSGRKQGSSFSLGYFADSYVDFGYIGMFLPIALIGWFVASIYKAFMRLDKINILFRFALVCIVLYEFTSFEADGLFFVGRLLIMFLVYWFLARFAFAPLQKWLYKRPDR